MAKDDDKIIDVKRLKAEEKPKTLLEMLAKDAGVHIQVVEQMLKLAQKFKGSIPRLMLVKNRSVLEETLTSYFKLTEELLKNMMLNLENQEKVLETEKKRFQRIMEGEKKGE